MRKCLLLVLLALTAWAAAGPAGALESDGGVFFEVATTGIVREPATDTEVMVYAGNMTEGGRELHLARIRVLTPEGKKLLTEQMVYHRLENIGKITTSAEVRARLGLSGPVDAKNRLKPEEFERIRPGLYGGAFSVDLRALGVKLIPGASLRFVVRAEFMGGGRPIFIERVCTIEYREPLPKIAAQAPTEPGVRLLTLTPTAWYWCAGDGHCHTAFSDAFFISVDSRVGAMDDYGFYWLLLTDHAASMDAAAFSKELTEAAAASTKYGRTASAGLELGTRKGDNANSNDSHYLAYNLASFIYNKNETRDGQGIINAVNVNNPPYSFGTIAHPYNGSYPWTYWTAIGYRGMELLSGTEGNANPNTLSRWDSLLTAGVPGTLINGRFTVGVGNSDAHNFMYGEHMTYLLLPGLTPPLADVYNALQNGWAVASTDGSFADFSVNGFGIGSVISVGGGTPINISLRAFSVDSSTYVRGFRIIGRGGQVLRTVPVSGKLTSYETTVTIYPGEAAYPMYDGYFRVEAIFLYDGFWSDDTWYVYCNPVFFDLV